MRPLRFSLALAVASVFLAGLCAFASTGGHASSLTAAQAATAQSASNSGVPSDVLPLPGLPPATASAPGRSDTADNADKPVNPDSKLDEKNRLEIIRFVDGEFAKAVVPLPHSKKGFKLAVGKPLDAKSLKYALRSDGVSANAGDRVQITKVEFRSHEIEFQINGGAKKPFHLMQHLQVGVGGTGGAGPPIIDNPNEGHGTTLILDFGRPIPNVSPDDLKADLSQLLDFSTHSAAVNWIDTLPPPIQQAIKDHHATVGMDQEMVIAAVGRPDKKVRSRDPETNEEIEDWIYGEPPARVTFVTFSMEKDRVIRVKVFD